MIPSSTIKRRSMLGNTFEKEFECAKPNLEKAISLLWPKLIQFYPDFTQDLIIERMTAGVRLNASTRLPVISKVNEKCLALRRFTDLKACSITVFMLRSLARALKEIQTTQMMLEP